MVWSNIKRMVAKKNMNFNLSVVEEQTRSQIDSITPEMFNNYLQYAIKEKEKYRALSQQDSE